MAIINDITITCVIIHNMIIEDENDTCLENLFEPSNVVHLRWGFSFKDLMQGTMELESVGTCHRLWGDLIKHLWAMKGSKLHIGILFEPMFEPRLTFLYFDLVLKDLEIGTIALYFLVIPF